MAKKLVRFIQDQFRWVELEYSWLRDGEMPSDPLKDLTTSNNELSTYEFEDEESFFRIASAYAWLRGKREKLDYIVFEPKNLDVLGIAKNQSNGTTSDLFVNQKHYDLVKLSAEDIVRFAHHLSKDGELGRVLEEKLFQEIYKSWTRGWITGNPSKHIQDGLQRWTTWRSN